MHRYRQAPLLHSPSSASLQSSSSSNSPDDSEASITLTNNSATYVNPDAPPDPASDTPANDVPVVEIFRPANVPINFDDEIDDIESDTDSDDEFDQDLAEDVDGPDDDSIHSNHSNSDHSPVTAKDNADNADLKKKRGLLAWNRYAFRILVYKKRLF